MTINLRDFYPFYTSDEIINVSDEIGAVLLESKRLEKNYIDRLCYHKAYYSLDRNDGIENDILFIVQTPEDIYERKIMIELLYAAISSLPDKQAKRIYAHFFLGISKVAIAQSEKVDERAIRDSIERGLKNIKNFLKKNL